MTWYRYAITLGINGEEVIESRNTQSDEIDFECTGCRTTVLSAEGHDSAECKEARRQLFQDQE